MSTSNRRKDLSQIEKAYAVLKKAILRDIED
jgi:hypothetical protein